MLLKKRQTSTLKLFSRLTDGWLLPLKFSSLRLSLNTFFQLLMLLLCCCCCCCLNFAPVEITSSYFCCMKINHAWNTFSTLLTLSLFLSLFLFGLNVISLCSTLSSHLSCAIIFFLSLSCDQSDQMARLFFHYLAKYNNDILPDSVSF